MTAVSLENLVAQHKNLQGILDDVLEGIIAHDTQPADIYSSTGQAEKITGHSREEVLGRDCHLWGCGSPFCGTKCSFCGQPMEAMQHHSYTMNISTRSGDLRRIEIGHRGV